MQQLIKIKQHIPLPCTKVFSDLSDHQTFGQIVSADIVRVVDSDSDHINGVGSVRRISSMMAPSFEETVVKFEKDRLIEYTVSRGSPVINHIGRIVFSERGNSTLVDYTIAFEPRTPIPGWGGLLARLIRYPLSAGLRAYAERAETNKIKNAEERSQ